QVNSWSGSIEIGLTALDPAALDFPSSATGLKGGSWIVSGCSVLRDGRSVLEEYGRDLDQLVEGDQVGIQRTPGGSCTCGSTGRTAASPSGLPPNLWAVVDLYGKCTQVTVVSCEPPPPSAERETGKPERRRRKRRRRRRRRRRKWWCVAVGRIRGSQRWRPLMKGQTEKCLSSTAPTADSFVPTWSRTQIRIDKLVDKWSGSIEIGVTTHNPNNLDYPATMTNLRSGTIMMSGCGILTNGKGTRREYCEFSLDELQVWLAHTHTHTSKTVF
ncbi:unnamed protein product, partial [Tetraodon nigroviridis]